MQELARAISSQAEANGQESSIDPHKMPGAVELEDAAAAWASSCIRTYTGELLRRGLGISRALADFVAELERDR